MKALTPGHLPLGSRRSLPSCRTSYLPTYGASAHLHRFMWLYSIVYAWLQHNGEQRQEWKCHFAGCGCCALDSCYCGETTAKRNGHIGEKLYKCCFTVRVLTPEQLAEYTWPADRVERWMELQKCPYSWTWRPEERYTWKVVSTKFKLLIFGFWLRFIKPEFISMHRGRWWGCARYICTYSWTRNKILWLCEAFHLEA